MSENIKNTNELGHYYFHQGSSSRAYEYLGVHKVSDKYVFRVWAPNADSAYVVGDFNNWDESCPMTRVTEKGVLEAYVEDGKFSVGSLYKFKFKKDGREIYKADPYAFYCQLPPETASVYFETEYKWKDIGWLKHRKDYMSECYSRPLNIYELHIDSWKKNENGERLTYRELAAKLAPYVKEMGFTHVELMPIMEHPYCGSWGYQVCGYYAPSSRWGTPDDFRYFVDYMHRSGIGVILDWVPAHFPKDAHGLYEFDGGLLYEYQGIDRIEHEGWGTRRFDIGREEVQSFLISNAIYWLKEFHADGLRVDAVASMLYLDYDKRPGEWVPNVYGDNRCLEAIAFFKKLNSAVATEFPDAMMIAEESTAFANITGFENNGLGFTYKWNMGWMNDTLNYVETDPYFRSGNHSRLTFPICYSFSEKYILPISHDEVVHGKKSFLDKMPGEYEQKFAGARLFSAYRTCFPGKKLSFMGEEIGQFREWDYEGEIEWFLLKYPSHSAFQKFVADINHFYLSHHALYEQDDSFYGFEWIYPDLNDISVTAFKRIAKNRDELIAVFNFTPVIRENFIIPVSDEKYKEVFNTDLRRYGGQGIENTDIICSESDENGNRYIKVKLPPLGCVIFEKAKQ